jgi:superfamily II DNA/RNA helicase
MNTPMTEDDTFNTLKQVPVDQIYDQTVKLVMSQASTKEIQDFARSVGWEPEDLAKAIMNTRVQKRNGSRIE